MLLQVAAKDSPEAFRGVQSTRGQVLFLDKRIWSLEAHWSCVWLRIKYEFDHSSNRQAMVTKQSVYRGEAFYPSELSGQHPDLAKTLAHPKMNFLASMLMCILYFGGRSMARSPCEFIQSFA